MSGYERPVSGYELERYILDRVLILPAANLVAIGRNTIISLLNNILI